MATLPVTQPKQCRYCQRWFMSIPQRAHHEANARRLCKVMQAARVLVARVVCANAEQADFERLGVAIGGSAKHGGWSNDDLSEFAMLVDTGGEV